MKHTLFRASCALLLSSAPFASGGIPTYPGTGVDLVLRSGTTGAPSDVDVKDADLDSQITMRIESPGGTYALGVLSVQGFQQGEYGGPTPGAPDFAINLFDPWILLKTFLIPVGGKEFSFALPPDPSLADSSLLFQAYAVDESAPVGFVASDGHEIRLPRSAVHVSEATGADSATGYRNDPLRTIDAARAMAELEFSSVIGYPKLRIASGVYSETVTFDLPMSIEGSLDPLTWTPDLLNRTILDAPHSGTRFLKIEEPMTVEAIDFRSASAPAVSNEGAAAISRGVFVVASTSDLVFTDCVFESGIGGPGADGVNLGGVPAPANDGANGKSSDPVPYDAKEGGIGGVGSNPGETATMFGGLGGRGAVLDSNDGTRPFFLSDSFIPLIVPQNCGGPPGSGGGPVVNKSGTNGGNGGPGADGFGGQSSDYGGIAHSNGLWSSGIGTDGTAGASGCGGSGGGGGTGAFWSGPFPPFYTEWTGAGGGGGGAGGFGGRPGTAGTNGGASFAVQLQNSSPVFSSCFFVAGLGGAGGSGGSGTIGGPGGVGGDGGSSLAASVGVGPISIDIGLGGGGDGGHGGTGGHGGGGAGGHGGPSYGVYRGGSSNPIGLFDGSHNYLVGGGGSAGTGGALATDGTVGPSLSVGP